MELCPDNSTACLLRALLQDNTTQAILDALNQANSEYNWNPLTFAFTVAIGALAFVVACVTVFQGLLAAGPGRIKAGELAIGPWASCSRSKFDWTELGLRTTALVPHIDQRMMLTILSEPETCLKPSPNHGRHAASWVNLLGMLDMLYIEPSHHLRKIQTDVLPSDVQAAPATANMMLLLAMAATTDERCTLSMSNNGRFTTATGPRTALSIREHPMLGSVAVYESYDTTFMPEAPRRAFDVDDTLTWTYGYLSQNLHHYFLLSLKNRAIAPPSYLWWRYVNQSRSLYNTSPQAPLYLLLVQEKPIRFPRLFPKSAEKFGFAVQALSYHQSWEASRSTGGMDSFLDLATRLWPDSFNGGRYIPPTPDSEYGYLSKETKFDFYQKILPCAWAHLDQFDIGFGSTSSNVPRPRTLEADAKSMVQLDDSIEAPTFGSTGGCPLPLAKQVFVKRAWTFIEVGARLVAELTRTHTQAVHGNVSPATKVSPEIYQELTAFEKQTYATFAITLLNSHLQLRDEKLLLYAALILVKTVESHMSVSSSQQPPNPSVGTHSGVAQLSASDSGPPTADSLQPKETMFGIPLTVLEHASFDLYDHSERVGNSDRLEFVYDEEIRLAPYEGTSLYHHPPAPPGAHDGPHRKFSKNTTREDKEEVATLVEVLRFRALLHAVVVDQCTDSSDFLSDDIQNVVVKVL